MRKSKLINDKKCNFAPCIRKIAEEAPREFQFASFCFLTEDVMFSSKKKSRDISVSVLRIV